MSTFVLLVDAFNLIRRIFEARHDSSAHVDEVVDASVRSLGRALHDHSPTHACVVFDSHERTWRHLLYADYKANREPTPSALLDNLDHFREGFEGLGVRCLKLPSYEADDPIATLAAGVADNRGVATILSTDRLFLQLLGGGVRVFNHFEGHEFTAAEVRERYGVDVAQLIDYWAMAGDSSNNIKGVPRVGPKTAAALLGRYGSLDAILRAAEGDPPAARVCEHRDLVRRCKQLVTLKTDVELGINLKSLRL